MNYTRGLLLGALAFSMIIGMSHGLASSPNLTLQQGAAQVGQVMVEVKLTAQAGDVRPVLAEVFVSFNPAKLAFVSAVDGQNGKPIFGHVVEGRLIRITMAGMNVTPARNGVIARLLFDSKAERPARVEIDTNRTQFAPKAAQLSLRTGPAIMVRATR